MNSDVERGVKRAKELLATARHATMATVNKDGSPHNTPYYFLYDETLEHLYWASHPESLHSGNVVRSQQIFVVVYDMVERSSVEGCISRPTMSTRYLATS